VPYPDQVRQRFSLWQAQQANKGRTFTPDQTRWLEMIRDHIATSLEVTPEDFDYTPFVAEGGLGRAREVFGPGLNSLLEELQRELSA
jgi:type I restriction enzyme R subunit